MAEGRYTGRTPTTPGDIITSLGRDPEVGPNLRELVQIDIKGKEEVQENLQNLMEGLIAQTAMETKMGARSILDRATYYCPEKHGHLKASGKMYQVDVLDSAWVGAMEWPQNVDQGSFRMNQPTRMVWEVSFGGESATGVNVDYAALIHENDLQWTIHKDVNPEAIDHWLRQAWLEHEEYISLRIMDRLKKQIARAAVTPALRPGQLAVRKKYTPVYDDEVPF